MCRAVLAAIIVLTGAVLHARPAMQTTAASDDDLTVVISVLQRARRGDDRSFCELRVQDRGELVALSAADPITVRVYEDDPIGDDLVFSLDSTVDADEAAAGQLDRTMDCSAFFQDSGDAGDSVEIYASASIEKAQCGTFCLNDRATSANLIVALDDRDPGEDDDIESQATFLVEGLMADEVCADVDWWQFDLSSSASILLEVLHRPEAGELDVLLHDASAAQAATPTLDHDATRYAVQLDAGSYWLSVAPRVSSDPNFYDLRLSVVETNGAPILTAGRTLNYVEGDGDQVLDPGVRVIDDGAQIVGATLSIDQGFVSGDALGHAGTPDIDASYEPLTGVLLLSGAASLSAYQQTLREVTFASPGDDPVSGRRRVRMVVDDGSMTSLAAYSFVQVQAVNDLPVIEQGAPETWELLAGQDFETRLSAHDAEGDTLTWGGINLPEGATVDTASGTFFWRPTQQDLGDYEIRITVSDGQGTVGVDRSLRVVDIVDGGTGDAHADDSGHLDVADSEAGTGDAGVDDQGIEDGALLSDSALPVDRAGGDAGGACQCNASSPSGSRAVFWVLMLGVAVLRRRSGASL